MIPTIYNIKITINSYKCYDCLVLILSLFVFVDAIDAPKYTLFNLVTIELALHILGICVIIAILPIILTSILSIPSMFSNCLWIKFVSFSQQIFWTLILVLIGTLFSILTIVSVLLSWLSRFFGISSF